jgi:diacylglycerol kinase (ATP)
MAAFFIPLHNPRTKEINTAKVIFIAIILTMPTLILINPAAGRKVGLEALSKLVSSRFEQETEEFEIHVPSTPDDWSEKIRSAPEQGYDKLLAVGGDGSIHLSLQSMDFEKIALGVLPTGSGNDIFRAFGIPINLKSGLENFFAGEEKVDVGEASGRYFLNTAGCGLDTWTVEIKNQSKGWLARNYLFLFFKIIRALRPLGFEIDIDGTILKRRGYWAIAANNRYIGGGMKIAPEADMRDGLLDVLIVGDVPKAEMIWRIPQIFKGTHVGHPKIEIFRGRNVIINCTEKMTCALDGDLYGSTPLEIKLHQGKLRLRGNIKPSKRSK